MVQNFITVLPTSSKSQSTDTESLTTIMGLAFIARTVSTWQRNGVSEKTRTALPIVTN